jgi:hypothetical protein
VCLPNELSALSQSLSHKPVLFDFRQKTPRNTQQSLRLLYLQFNDSFLTLQPPRSPRKYVVIVPGENSHIICAGIYAHEEVVFDVPRIEHQLISDDVDLGMFELRISEGRLDENHLEMSGRSEVGDSPALYISPLVRYLHQTERFSRKRLDIPFGNSRGRCQPVSIRRFDSLWGNFYFIFLMFFLLFVLVFLVSFGSGFILIIVQFDGDSRF